MFKLISGQCFTIGRVRTDVYERGRVQADGFNALKLIYNEETLFNTLNVSVINICIIEITYSFYLKTYFMI